MRTLRPHRRHVVRALLWSLALVSSGARGEPTPSPPLPDPELCSRVTREFVRAGGLPTVSFAGIRSVQTPMDNWMVQQILSELRPDFVIETGTLNGGTTLFYATVLGQVQPKARVLTVDIEKQWDKAAMFPAWKERVEFFRGSSKIGRAHV